MIDRSSIGVGVLFGSSCFKGITSTVAPPATTTYHSSQNPTTFLFHHFSICNHQPQPNKKNPRTTTHSQKKPMNQINQISHDPRPNQPRSMAKKKKNPTNREPVGSMNRSEPSKHSHPRPVAKPTATPSNTSSPTNLTTKKFKLIS